MIISFGGVLLIFALFFSLKEYLDLSNAAAFFSIGIIVFVIGLLLKVGESNG
jgi:energy-converting hydrogenase Eha subunit C